MPWRRLENVFKTSWRRLVDVLKKSWKCLEDTLKTSWRCLKDVLKTSWRRLEDVWQDEYVDLDEDVLKTSSKDIWVRQIYSSWSRRLEDVLKPSSEDEDQRRLQDASSRRIFAGMERFVIIVNGFQPLTIITKRNILDDAAALDPPLIN